MDLPTVENVYIENMNIVHKYSGTVAEKYGPCHWSWVSVAANLENAMHATARSLQDTANGVIQAINEYTHVDGDSAKQLTAIGQDFEDKIDAMIETDPSLGPVDRKDYGEAETPNYSNVGMEAVEQMFGLYDAYGLTDKE